MAVSGGNPQTRRRLPDPPRGWDQLWAAELVRELENFFTTRLFGDRIINARLVSLSGRRLNVSSVTDATYTVKKTDDVVDCNRAGTIALTLSAGPELGQRHQIQDSSGNASVNTITIAPPAGPPTINLNGGTTAIDFNIDYGRITIIYNGTQYIAAL